MKKLLRWTIYFLLTQSSFAALSSEEIKLQQYIVTHESSQIAFLKKLVNINSGTNNIKGVRRVGEMMRQPLNQLGFKTKWINMPTSLHRAGTLIAERQGKRGKKLLLIAHLDTVFPPNHTNKRFMLDKPNAKGDGIVDDKGGLVVMLYALKALQANHQLNNTSITIVLTGDEEDSGKPTHLSRKALIELAQGMDVALDFEPSVTLDTATIARRGISLWRIETSGNESHSSTIFQKDVGF